MSDDLVKRLRTQIGYQDVPFIKEEAADRIEELEGAIDWQIGRAEAAEAKLAKAEWLLIDASVQLRDGKIKTRRNRAELIEKFLAELTGGKDER